MFTTIKIQISLLLITENFLLSESKKEKYMKLLLSGWTEHFGIYVHKNQQMHQKDHFIVVLNRCSDKFRR
jgi:hypothetical protein